jgi:hypothetical protein
MSRSRRHRLAVVVACCTVLACGARAADSAASAPDLPPPAKIDDLDYGDVLFHFFQDDYFEALVRLEASRDMARLGPHAADADLLSGGLYLSLGMHAEATTIFDRLLAGPVPRSVSDRAHFYLARIGYQRGYYAEAWRSLERIHGVLPGPLEAERRLLAANVLMAAERFGEAATLLERWSDDTGWSSYARFNLGVALVRSGDPARGRALLEVVGSMAPGDEEQRALRDRANLALGFTLLQQHDAESAVAALARVRLTGPFTNRALLGLGWAEADANRPERALVPWLELREGRVLDAAVQESFLAVPYAYATLASTGQAAEQYRLAVAAYGAESVRIDESITAIRSGGFLDAILEATPEGEGVGWLWQLQSAPDAPHTRYLYHLLASHEFHEGLRNYRDLRIMRGNLERWSGSLEVFDGMIEAREAAIADRLPRKARALEALDVDLLERRHAGLAARLAAVTRQRDVVALGTVEQARQWQHLERAEARVAALPPGDRRDALAERVRLLRGSVLWDLDAAYKLSLWKLKASLGETAAALDELRRRRDLVEAAAESAPRGTEGFADRVVELARRVKRLQPRIEAAAAAQERLLASLAIRELEAQKARLANYGMQAQFALAALYDGAVAEAAP